METLPPHASCPITQLLNITGERWSFVIIRDLFYGVRRFDALQQHLGISKKVLATRLKHLQQQGILEKHPYQQRPARFEYHLTAKGKDLFPVLLSMMQWGQRWGDMPVASSATLVHQCGHPLEAKMLCRHCNQPLSPARVKLIHQQ